MNKIAIVGTGPTGIYTLLALLKHQTPLSISLYEQSNEAGVGMPYSDEENSRLMLANIASIEIPPITSSYLDWLRQQSVEHLARYGVKHASLHDRQFLPRILLGEYFRDQFLRLVNLADKQEFNVTVHESCQVKDVKATTDGVVICSDHNDPEHFDLAVIATGHVWPDAQSASRTFFPSPWTGLMEAKIPACNVGILGTSLSAIDAAMAVVAQHGRFVLDDAQGVHFERNEGSQDLNILLMSRSGILPEADFYCPLPYEPLSIVTAEALEQCIADGSAGLLDRIFMLIVKEIELADPVWSKEVALSSLNADSFTDVWFAARKKHDPFHWAAANLEEVERNKREKHTVAWRYAILRLHEAVQEIVPWLDEKDRERFNNGLARVFIDNYAAIPSQSIRRLLALREAGILNIRALGQDYQLEQKEKMTVIRAQGETYEFEVFIDARGQKALKIKDLPFPSLRDQLQSTSEEIPDVGDDYTLQAPDIVRGRIALAALPWLMHDQPFVQGLTACAEIGQCVAQAISRPATRLRRRLPYYEA